ncbi:helix-turn-helix domain-containing protein [Virgibacillus flavescens]|uniref:helix-turn-helix domain-containing protein n=1 Tax=Virgibacillus flavescens TaxID=1611422 RepID=UPI003D33748C
MILDNIGVYTDTIYSIVKSKQIPHLKNSTRILFAKDSIHLWIQYREYINLRI